MIIKALNTFGGVLDLSAMERLQESNPCEKYPFRLFMRPGDQVEADDKFYTLTRIQEALSLGYIEIGGIATVPALNNSLVDPSFSGVTMTQTAGEDLAFGDAVYYGADEKVHKARANSLTTMPCIGMATGTVTSGNEATILIDGFIRSSTAFSFTAGSQASSSTALVYVGPNSAGEITQAIPDSYPNIVQMLGYAATSDVLAFRPDPTFIEMAQLAVSSSSSSSSVDSSSSSSSSSSLNLSSSSSSIDSSSSSSSS